MTSYLLLRDNKESGPYSFEELKQKGLKAYDLIWVSGKSAAWRYPSEVEEFKSFAPAVEEQPFDRFFKRPSQVTATATAQPQQDRAFSRLVVPQEQTVSGATATATAPTVNNPIPSEPSSIPGKRIIYVTLPAGRSAASLKPQPAFANDNSRFQPAAAQPAPQQTQPITPPPVALPVTSQAAPVKETASRTELSSLYVQPRTITDPPIEENFAHDQDDMWKTHVEIAPRSQNSILKRILQPVAAAVVILALVAAGIFIGLSINKDSLGFLKKIGARESTQQPVSEHNEHAQPATLPSPVSPAQSSPAPAQTPDLNTQTTSQTTTQTAQPSNSTIDPPPTNTLALSKASDAKPGSPALLPPVVRKKASPVKDKPVVMQKPSATATVKDSTFSPLPMINRQAVHRSDAATPDKDAIKSNIANLVSVSNNTFNVGTFGGISELQLTVSNRSIYPLDLVVVEVEYVQANKKVFKTEDLYFRGIGPGSALMQEAPKSPRGIKVQYKITLINSKDLNLSFSAL